MTSLFQEQISYPRCVHTWTLLDPSILGRFNVDVKYSYIYI